MFSVVKALAKLAHKRISEKLCPSCFQCYIPHQHPAIWMCKSNVTRKCQIVLTP